MSSYPHEKNIMIADVLLHQQNANIKLEKMIAETMKILKQTKEELKQTKEELKQTKEKVSSIGFNLICITKGIKIAAL